jgi:hypothetical protein
LFAHLCFSFVLGKFAYPAGFGCLRIVKSKAPASDRTQGRDFWKKTRYHPDFLCGKAAKAHSAL